MQVMKEDRPLWKFPWWDPEDNHALLVYYHCHGVYLYRQNRVALSAWALDLLEASNTHIDFTVWVSPCMALCWCHMLVRGAKVWRQLAVL